MLLTEYRPQPKLVTKTTITTRPRFPVIDTHNHLGGGFGGGWHRRPVAELLEALDAAGVLCYMDLDGSWSEDILQGWLDKFKAAVPDRFYFFGGVNWDVWPEQGNRFGESAAGRLRAQVAWGAQGLKIWKVFGPRGRDQRGHLVAVNDSRLVPLWETAAELNIPVLIHVADPAAFFDPLDPGNERRGEFQVHREWHFPSPPFPAFLTIIEQFAHLVQRHPQTKFIGAHVGGYAENLGWIGQLLDNCPNFYVDISARTCELRRQPYTAR
ncbi:MAG: amidohydrolase family protein, partial [Chloroflexi bacterium]|nr:amidohydrolase family protein [Chloroflexota bacterium]